MTNTTPVTADPGSVRFPLADFLQMELTSPKPGICLATVPVSSACLNPHANVHGGVLFTLVDTAMGGATMSALTDGQRCASVEVSMRYLEPVTQGTVTATASILRRGRSIVHLEARVTRGDSLVAVGQGTFAVIGTPPPRSAGISDG